MCNFILVVSLIGFLFFVIVGLLLKNNYILWLFLVMFMVIRVIILGKVIFNIIVEKFLVLIEFIKDKNNKKYIIFK